MTKNMERFEGALLGQAVGDALGSPVEGMSREWIESNTVRVERMLDPKELGLDIMCWRMPGLYTDDTQLALLIADTLVRTGAFSADTFVHGVLDLVQPDDAHPYGALRGSGPNFRVAIDAWRDGSAWNQTGTATAGNGAAMRIAPVGLFYASNPAQLVRVAAEASICTHAHPTGILAAISLALLVGALSETEPRELDSAALAGWIRDWTLRAAEVLNDEYEPYLHERVAKDDPWLSVVRMMPGWVDESGESALKQIVAHAETFSAVPLDTPAASFAPASVALAIQQALSGAANPAETLVRIVSLGGDTDTTGAMCGAALGALHGSDWLARWLPDLHNTDEIRSLARALHHTANGRKRGETPNVVQREHDLSRMEYERWLDLQGSAR